MQTLYIQKYKQIISIFLKINIEITQIKFISLNNYNLHELKDEIICLNYLGWFMIINYKKINQMLRKSLKLIKRL